MNEMRALTGSERDLVPGAKWVSEVGRDEACRVTIICRRPDQRGFIARLTRTVLSAGEDGVQSTGTATARESMVSRDDDASTSIAPMSRAAYAARFGADPADMQCIREFANAYALRVEREEACSRSIVLTGTVAQMERAFGIRLHRFAYEGGHYRGYTGPIRLPETVLPVVQAVLGLDDRLQARPSFRLRPPTRLEAARSTSATAGEPQGEPALQALAQSAVRAFTPIELSNIYDFPDGDGAGQCIAIIELGGGYDTNDLQTYFATLGVPAPQVVSVSVDGGRNDPSQDPNSPDGEVMLDIEIAGAIAPRSRIAVYFAPNSDAGFIDALNAALHDQSNRPSVVSISWGKPEAYWSVQALKAFNDALQTAATLGVTVCVASGDDGSADGIRDGHDHVDFPASSPFALACGGTRLVSNSGGTYSETVWNNGWGAGAGGGGVSTYFALPPWQNGLTTKTRDGRRSTLTARGVPDVAGVGDPETGYIVRVHGENVVIGGTSAVSPLWAGLIARINANSGKTLGFFHQRLYRNGGVCHDVTQGNNGDFAASTGWDACTGFGSPDGRKVAALIG